MIRLSVGMHDRDWEVIKTLCQKGLTAIGADRRSPEALVFRDLMGRLGSAYQGRAKAIAKIEAKRALREAKRELVSA